MKTKHVFRILSVVLLVIMTLSAASPAYAGTHVQEVIQVDDSWIWSGSDADNPCGFDIGIHEYGTYRVNYWLDEDEQITREIDIFGNMKLVMSANGKTLNVLYQGPAHWVYSEDKVVLKVTGTNAAVTVPGYGKVDGSAGLLIITWDIDAETGEWINGIEVKWVGSKDFVSEPNPICAYLGSE
jgi:hypothetical protein